MEVEIDGRAVWDSANSNFNLQLTRFQTGTPLNGVLIIDKPSGLTSHDVVHRLRRILRERSIGHLGTLDPMATGVLPLVCGSFTRLAQFYVASEKVYEGTIRFGFSTDTYDAEGEPTSTPQPVLVTREELEKHAAGLRGLIEQVPPPFSAKKINGVPAYKLARRQKDVNLKPVQVEIRELDIFSVEGDCAQFRARVGSGTYMRSLAHDLGKSLGCGAHLQRLRRTVAGDFAIEDAHTLEDVAAVAGNCPASELADEIFVHPRKLLPEFPAVTADEMTAARIRAGRTVNLPELSRARLVKVFSGQRELVAIATRVAGTLFHAKLVLAASDVPVRC